MQPIDGVGDKAYLLPGGVAMFVLKGDSLFVLNFTFPPGPDKTSDVARKVITHL